LTARQPFMRWIFRPLAAACLAFVAPWIHAAAPDPALTGCWRAVKIVLITQDGSKVEDTSGRCTLRYKDDGLESACGTSGGPSTTTYRTRILRPGFYAATMVGSTFKTDLLGSTREYEYKVAGDRLTTATQPQIKVPTAPAGAGRVELEATRTPCP
jgi:hypothetical protein